MRKVGRNEACPCGSGRKYKQCCADWHERAQRAARAAYANDADGPAHQDALDSLSNQANGAFRAGHLEEAEALCAELQQRFPEVPDGWERLAPVKEAQGELAAARDCYRKTLGFIAVFAEDGDYDAAFIQKLRAAVERLDTLA